MILLTRGDETKKPWSVVCSVAFGPLLGGTGGSSVPSLAAGWLWCRGCTKGASPLYGKLRSKEKNKGKVIDDLALSFP